MMFATKLLLRYAVKPISPPRNIVPQEITKSFEHEPQINSYTTACMTRSEAKQAIQDANLIKSLRLQRLKLCSRSEPKRVNRRSMTELEQSIINHPNFEKAAALVRLLGDNNRFVGKQRPHRIGSMPKGNFHHEIENSHKKTVDAAVKIVKDVLNASRDMNQEPVEIDEEVDHKRPEQKKPYVINIYLDTKQGNVIEEADIKEKIKEFWQENVKQLNQKRRRKSTKEEPTKYIGDTVSSATIAKPSKVKQIKVPEDKIIIVPEKKIEKQLQEKRTEKGRTSKSPKATLRKKMLPDTLEQEEEGITRRPSKRSKSPRTMESLGANSNDSEPPDDLPRYRISPVQKLRPDPTSTTNPHTDRLAGGTPKNYDLDQRIREVIEKVTPVNTGGFSKYLTFWKDMWAKRQEAKEKEEESAAAEEEQPNQPFKTIENDKVFKETTKGKQNPYETAEEGEEDSASETKETEKREKSPYRQQQRNYSTRRYLHNICTNENPCLRSKGTTHIQINEKINNGSLEYRHNNYFSTLCKPTCRCDTKTAGGIGSKVSEKDSKANQTRVDDFVGKLKNALTMETKTGYKDVKVLYNPKEQGNDNDVHMSSEDKEEDSKNVKNNIKRNINSVNKKLKNDD